MENLKAYLEEDMKIYGQEELKKRLKKGAGIFIAGYSTLTDDEKKEADKLIKELKDKGHEVVMGI